MTEALAQDLPGDVVRIAPRGRLDTFSVSAFERALIEQLERGRARLVVDLTDVTYVSSSGLRALLSARRRARSAGGDVALCCMSPRVREIFEMVGFVSLFNIFPSAQAAADALRADEAVRS